MNRIRIDTMANYIVISNLLINTVKLLKQIQNIDLKYFIVIE